MSSSIAQITHDMLSMAITPVSEQQQEEVQPGGSIVVIEWACGGVVESVDAEHAMSRVVMRRGDKPSRGRDLPVHRREEIARACATHGMHEHQALSLRRQLFRAKPGGMRRVNQSHAMGSPHGQEQAARLFEKAVHAFLRDEGARFLTEEEQRARAREAGATLPPTPDVLFNAPTTINGVSVNWLECKLFYGCAMLAGYGNLPVGKLAATARRYRDAGLGEGGFVFGQGFCADLHEYIPDAVIMLDGSEYGSPLDLSELISFQNAQT